MFLAICYFKANEKIDSQQMAQLSIRSENVEMATSNPHTTIPLKLTDEHVVRHCVMADYCMCWTISYRYLLVSSL